MPSREEQDRVSSLLRDLECSPCIVELGAHTGEDEEWIRAACRDPRQVHYVMVEPDPRNCQAILDRHAKVYLYASGRQASESSKGWFQGTHSMYKHSPLLGSRRLIIGAIADENGIREFNFSQDMQGRRTSGSLRQPTGHLKYFPEIGFPFKGMVPVFTLDHIFESEWLTKIDLLWADIQGAEDMMIRGGQTALKHTRYLFMEIEKEELYGGEKLGHELIAMLPGWEVIEQFPYNVLMRNTEFSERGPR